MISGLIRKDVLNIKSTAAYMIVVSVIFSAVFRYSSIMIPVMMLTCLIGTTFTYDRNTQGDSYAVSIGVKRKAIVDSKFILSFCLLVIGLVIGIAVTSAYGLITDDSMEIMDLVDPSIIAISAGLIATTICCVINYIVSSDKALAVSGLTASICVVVAITVSAVIGYDGIDVPSSIPMIMFVIAVIVSIAGYATSQKLLDGKDL